jgi:hypothetical protein
VASSLSLQSLHWLYDLLYEYVPMERKLISSLDMKVDCDHRDDGGYGDEDDLTHQNESNHTLKEEEK